MHLYQFTYMYLLVHGSDLYPLPVGANIIYSFHELIFFRKFAFKNQQGQVLIIRKNRERFGRSQMIPFIIFRLIFGTLAANWKLMIAPDEASYTSSWKMHINY